MIMETKFEITKIGERGQIVIPLAFRERMNLGKGEKFMVIEQNGNLILKRIVAPTREEVQDLLKFTREHAIKTGLTEKDVEEAIRRVRARKNENSSGH